MIEEKRATAAIGSVPVFVSDQERALAFYRDKLGFAITMDMPFAPGVRWLTVAPHKGATEFILFHPAMAGADADEMRRRVGTWTGIVLVTDDCRARYRELQALGVPFTAEPQQPFWGGWITELSDPDGNRFQLVERPAYLA
jgi:predicted enzyme related to lactoylglutathione lyase